MDKLNQLASLKDDEEAYRTFKMAMGGGMPQAPAGIRDKDQTDQVAQARQMHVDMLKQSDPEQYARFVERLKQEMSQAQ